MKRAGNSPRVSRFTEAIKARFFAKVNKTDSCWLWTAGKNTYGYGVFRMGGHRDAYQLMAHRVAYEILKGPIPVGLQLDHLCRNRACVNPDHCEPVTNKQNVLRGEGRTAVNGRKTHCPRGHSYSGSNLIFRAAVNQRACRACSNARKRHRRMVNAALALPNVPETAEQAVERMAK